MGRPAGKIAFISGTGAGTGRAAALVFEAEGASVFGCEFDADGEGKRRNDCRQHGEGLHHAVQAVAHIRNFALAA
jgi:NADP-dependent 3-hydroxy acid dehydrogenase YdfG